MDILNQMIARAKANPQRIVLPEGDEPRTLEAANILLRDKIANLILIGNGKRETNFLHSILLKKELNVFGSRNAYTRDFEHLIGLVSSDSSIQPERMISAIYDFTDAAKAFDALTHNDGHLEKVLLHFSDPE